MNTSRNEPQTNRLLATVSGGWNVVSNPLTMPREHSPDLLNVRINDLGNVSKRSGTEVHITNTTAEAYTDRSLCVPFKFTNNYYGLGTRNQKTFKFFIEYSPGNHIPLVIEGIFADETDTAVNYVIQRNYLYNRIVFCADDGTFNPTQIVWVEGTHTETIASPATNWAIDLPNFISSATGAEYFVLIFRNTTTGEVYGASVPSFNIALGIITFSTAGDLGAVPAGTWEMTWIGFFPQLWMEAARIDADMITDSVVQGTYSAHVPIPPNLLIGVEPLRSIGTSHSPYPLEYYSSTNFDTKFTDTTDPPTTTSQVRPTTGTLGGGGKVPIAPTFASFAGAPTTNRDVIFHRGYDLPFNGGRGMSQDAGGVHVVSLLANYAWLRYAVLPPSYGGAGTGSSSNAYYLRNTQFVPVTGSSGWAPYISFDARATANGGVTIPQEDTLLICNGYVNGAGVDTSVTPALGAPDSIGGMLLLGFPNRVPVFACGSSNELAAYPVFGLWEWIDSYEGSFPRTLCMFQERMVIGGTRDDPMHVIVSVPSDLSVPGFYSNDFQVKYARGSVTDAFDIILPGNSDEYITAVAEYNDSLFVFTRQQVYRIYSSETAVTSTNFTYSTVAEIGCVNPRCITVTPQGLVFLSPLGLYALTPSDDSMGYQLRELSIQIREYIRDFAPLAEDIPYTMFDGSRNELYVGLQDNMVGIDRCYQMLVYNFSQNAWYRYALGGGGGFESSCGCVRTSRTGLNDVFVMNTNTVSGTNQLILRLHTLRPFDKKYEVVYDNTTHNPYTIDGYATQRFQAVLSATRDNYNPTKVNNYKIRPLPCSEYEDMSVDVDGTPITFGTDWTKSNTGAIVLLSNPGSGTLTAYSKMRMNGNLYHPVAVVVNGVIIDPANYAVTVVDNEYVVTFNEYEPEDDDVVEFGFYYPAWYFTPSFSESSLNVKRVTDYFGYFDNSDLDDVWTYLDDIANESPLHDVRKLRSNSDVIVMYNDENSGFIDYEVYNPSSLDWDYEATTLNQQSKRYTRCHVPVFGTGYSIQVAHCTYSPNIFRLAGYELRVRPKPGNSYSKTE